MRCDLAASAVIGHIRCKSYVKTVLHVKVCRCVCAEVCVQRYVGGGGGGGGRVPRMPRTCDSTAATNRLKWD